VGMSADDDVLHAQADHGELHGRPFAAVGCPVGGHDVARVANDEQFTGVRLRDQVGADARVGTGDEQRVGMLTVGEPLEQLALRPGDASLEPMNTLYRSR